ncbi:MAG: 2-dehydro-3-deoxygalactonokinase [Ruminococcus sp.]|nr:2-dehydro-3-deoxygalactonokinase [Candidatus Apopatosoma intestinale]
MFLCLDGGTTNTRLRLMRGDTVVDTEKMSIGSSSHDKEPLKAAIREGIAAMLARNGLMEGDVAAVLSSGMITSEFGLYELPHLHAPAGLAEFHRGMVRVELPEITGIPFVFIPGFRNAPDSFMMMRGEESECLGLCALCDLHDRTAVILPGSHNKVILFDGEKITACYSMMSGELIAAAAEHTILRHCFERPFPKTFDEEALIRGAEVSRDDGLTAALLPVRSMSLTGRYSPEYLFSFLVGAILYSDVTAIRKYAGDLPLVIGGASPLKEELSALAGHFLGSRIVTVDAETAEIASAVGSLRIFGCDR